MSDAIDSWQAFWSAAAITSAILFGLGLITALLAVGEKPLARLHVKSLIYETLGAYGTVALIGLLVLMPILTLKRLGAVVATISAVLVLNASWQIVASRSEGSKLLGFHWTHLAPWICYVMVLWSSVKLMRGGMHSLNWLGIAALLLLMTGAALNIDMLRRAAD
jgi:hypothetical protein